MASVFEALEARIDGVARFVMGVIDFWTLRSAPKTRHAVPFEASSESDRRD